MRYPILLIDAWELGMPRSEILDKQLLNDRKKLKRGDAVKLIFMYMPKDKQVQELFENMWVTVLETVEHGYIGMLFNEPINASHSHVTYVKKGAEIPFSEEHVIDIQMPPPGTDVEKIIGGHQVTETWSRDEIPVTNQDRLAQLLANHAQDRLTTRGVFYPTALGLSKNGTIDLIETDQSIFADRRLTFIQTVLESNSKSNVAFAVGFLLPVKSDQPGPPAMQLIINTGGWSTETIRRFTKMCYQEPDGQFQFSELREVEVDPGS